MDEERSGGTAKKCTAPSDLHPNRFATPASAVHDYTDGRKLWEWTSKYPNEARRGIKGEAIYLVVLLVLMVLFTAIFLAISGQSLQFPLRFLATESDVQKSTLSIPKFVVDPHLVVIFFAGCVGGTTFSIKWLVHAVANGRWHLDRRYWRIIVPLLGGVYACAVITLFDGGFIGGQIADKARPIAASTALGFLIGYFSDGVSGLLSNVANAVFGTVEKK